MFRDLDVQFQRERLHRATQEGDLTAMEALLTRKYPVNRFDDLGKTPLHYAVQSGRLDVVERLIKAGANVNAHDERLLGDTPLADNAAKCSFEMAKRLVDAGADPTIQCWMQLTALDRAAKREDADAKRIQQLLAAAARGR